MFFSMFSRVSAPIDASEGFKAGSLFLAVCPDAEAAACIYRAANILKRANELGGALVRRERLHVTLFFLGEPCERIVRMAHDAGSAMRMPPFEVSFDRTASFRGQPGNHPFVLRGDGGLRGLMSFRQKLGASLTRNGLKRWANMDFTPHVTLLYDVRRVEEQPIEPVSWTVREFVLVHSLNGHNHLARWPLQG
jgi:2'-5' RNA ligase